MRQIIAAITLALLANAASATASGSVVFDPTNYSQTLITAGQSVKSVAEQVQGNLTKLRQLQEMYRQAKRIEAGDYAAIGGLVGQAELTTRIRDGQGMYNSLASLKGNIGDLQGRYDYMTQMSQKYGLTVQEYQDAQSRRVARDVAAAKLEQQANQRAIANVQKSYQTVQTWQAKIPDMTANTELMQMLNQQMAMLNAQNAQMVEYMARQNMAAQEEIGNKGAKETAEAEDKRKALDAANSSRENSLRTMRAELEAARRR